MSVTLNTKVYSLDSMLSANGSRYAAASSTQSVPDLLDAKRTAPKPTATFAGVQRASMKFHRAVQLNGVAGSYGTAIVEVSVSIPVGATQAAAESILDDAGDFCLLQAARDLMWKGTLSF